MHNSTWLDLRGIPWVDKVRLAVLAYQPADLEDQEVSRALLKYHTIQINTGLSSSNLYGTISPPAPGSTVP